MKRAALMLIFAAALAACSVPEASEQIAAGPRIFPDYAEVTVPVNIAPLNFRLDEECEAAWLKLESGDASCSVRGPEFDIPLSDWRALTAAGDISATVLVRRGGVWIAYESFAIHVSADRIDPWLTYRLIEPGYETWNEMGIYQRCLEDFTEVPLITNASTDKNCMNCHSFASRSADNMMFHMRATHGGTYILQGGKVEKVNTKCPEVISAGVYPQWHPSACYIAFSVNDIMQVFHSTDPNRIEVFDGDSDVVVYDVGNHRISSCQSLKQENVLETFPTFSPDGRKLYYCTSPRQEVPEGIKSIRYSLCSIDFDPESFSFGSEVDTLVSNGRSVSFPRVSPDGRFLMYTDAEYGCFSIWHKEADLHILDLTTGEDRAMDEINSPEPESYQTWSSDSRWIVFMSRRLDGLYTRLYISHISADGVGTKPFLVPQKSSRFYHEFFKSYNIPELVDGRVPVSAEDIAACAVNDKPTPVTYK